MSTDCIFCKIVAGDAPACTVYEDEHVLAFLDISPVIEGHTLVIPKRHYRRIEETPPEVLAQVIRGVRIVARAQRKGLDAQGLNVTQANGELAGQVVPHIHFHAIPRFAADGPVTQWKQRAYDGPEEMNRVAAKIRDAAEGPE